MLPPESGGHVQDPHLHARPRAPVRGPSDARRRVRPRAAAAARGDQHRDRRRRSFPSGSSARGRRSRSGGCRSPSRQWRAYERADELLGVLGVESELPVDWYDLGPTHVYVALRTPEEVAALRPDFQALLEFDAGVNCFAPLGGNRFKTRMFAPCARRARGSGDGLGRGAARGASPASRSHVIRATRSRSSRVSRSSGRRACSRARRERRRRSSASRSAGAPSSSRAASSGSRDFVALSH